MTSESKVSRWLRILTSAAIIVTFIGLGGSYLSNGHVPEKQFQAGMAAVTILVAVSTVAFTRTASGRRASRVKGQIVSLSAAVGILVGLVGLSYVSSSALAGVPAPAAPFLSALFGIIGSLSAAMFIVALRWTPWSDFPE